MRVSPDGKWAAALRTVSHEIIKVLLFDLTTPKKPPIIVSKKAAYEGTNIGVNFSYDSDYFYYQAVESGDFIETWIWELRSAEKSLLISAPHDVRYHLQSPNGKYNITSTNEDGFYKLSIKSEIKGEALLFSALPITHNIESLRFSRADESALLLTSRPNAPPSLYHIGLSDGAPSVCIIEAINPEIAYTDLVGGKIIRFTSFDDLGVPSVLYRPKDASQANPASAVVWVHGGPESQSRPIYLPIIQYLVNHGYAIIAPNFRGSGGYGRTYLSLNDKRHGEGDLQDVIYAKRYLETLDWVDADAVAVMGPSYGGFLSLSALVFHPDEFAAGVSQYGVADFVSLLENFPAMWTSVRASFFAEFGDPSIPADRRRLLAAAPLHAADRITKPLLLLHGAKDPRVPVDQTQRIFDVVQENNVDARILIFSDEGHGFNKRRNLIKEATEILRFLDEHLKMCEPTEEC